MKNKCMYCERSERLKSFTEFVAELSYSVVYLHTDRKYPGRCIVALKEHKDELFELSPRELVGYMAEVARMAEAIKNAVKADKINYAVFGDLMSHVHFHLVPKKKSGPGWGGAFEVVQNPSAPMSQAEIQSLIVSLRAALKL